MRASCNKILLLVPQAPATIAWTSGARWAVILLETVTPTVTGIAFRVTDDFEDMFERAQHCRPILALRRPQ